MSAISDLIGSAFSELMYDKKEKKAEEAQEEEKQEEPKKGVSGKKSYETIRETIGDPGSLAEFDRILGMLESNDSATRARGIAALDKMSDENRLACIAIFSKNPEARKAVMKRLRKRASLLDIVFSESLFRDTSAAAMEELASMLGDIEDQKVLTTLVCYHKDKRTRMKALSSIKDVKWLIEVAYSSRFEDSRWESIERLKDLNVDIDKEDLRQDDTLAILADQLVKSSISGDEIVEDMQIMLENVRYLQSISRNRGSDQFSDIVRDNLCSYQRILRSLATSSRHKEAREMALKGMEDDTAQLAEVAQHAEYEDTAAKAVDMLSVSMSGRSEPQALALVAAMSNDSDKRAKAVAKIQNAQMLKHVVKFSQYEDSRIAAAYRLAGFIDQLDDAESLRLVIAYARESKNRELAERRIRELEGAHASGKEKILEEVANPATGKRPSPKAERMLESIDRLDERAEHEEEPREIQKERIAIEPEGSGGSGLWGLLKELLGI
jgi:hypothetical protein